MTDELKPSKDWYNALIRLPIHQKCQWTGVMNNKENHQRFWNTENYTKSTNYSE